jgi:hypothetical protein
MLRSPRPVPGPGDELLRRWARTSPSPSRSDGHRGASGGDAGDCANHSDGLARGRARLPGSQRAIPRSRTSGPAVLLTDREIPNRQSLEPSGNMPLCGSCVFDPPRDVGGWAEVVVAIVVVSYFSQPSESSHLVMSRGPAVVKLHVVPACMLKRAAGYSWPPVVRLPDQCCRVKAVE